MIVRSNEPAPHTDGVDTRYGEQNWLGIGYRETKWTNLYALDDGGYVVTVLCGDHMPPFRVPHDASLDERKP